MQQTAVECVLVVPTSVFAGLGHFQGFTADVGRYLGTLFDPRHTSYRARAEMERDPAYKQLIPYCIFRHRAPDGAVRVFAYTRGGGQGEERLRRKRSIGVGGHISLADAHAAGAAAYEEGMRRELEEEVCIRAAYTQRCVGLINDDLTDVGRVHLGVVHLFDLERPAVEPREPDLLDAAFVSLEELAASRAQLESWSQICLDQFLLPKLA
jgi:predicted NUDIX family phosphoesterase